MQNLEDRSWFIRELLNDGKIGAVTDSGMWNNAYAVQFTYQIGTNNYLFGQNMDSKYWFVQRLLPNGLMGEELQGGYWKAAYKVQYPFTTVDGQQYFGGQDLSGLNWFIQKLNFV
jgi:hypothetical protein